MDFVHDGAANGQTLRFFAVVDQYSRTRVRLAVDTSMPARRAIQELETASGEHGKPKRIRMDNGSAFTSRRFLAWCTEQKIEMVHIRPGKPVENAHSESFNGRLREEFLNVTQFWHLWDAQAKARRWFWYDNEERPNSSLNYRTPPRHSAKF
jgi:putative transposase